CTTRLSGLW
nr:immunoglobulin heavy chain junction region [Homo sapiens]